MESREAGLERLKIILAQIGPGASLHIDERWMKHLFGESTGAAILAAQRFAEENSCGFRYERATMNGVFFRAYFRTGELNEEA
jgi:hypothetical protein